MKRVFVLIIVCLHSGYNAFAQPRDPDKRRDASFLLNLMKTDPQRFHYFISHKKELEIQIIYTQINRDANNVPVFKSFYYNVDSNRYFYPASTVKLPMALIALEKMERMMVPHLTRRSIMLHDSVYSGQKFAWKDSTSESGMPSMEHYIKKILVASDNDAYNRLYEFMGQQESNQIMNQKGYHIRFLHRLERALSPDENRHTEAVRFLADDSTLLFAQPMLVGDSIVVGRKILKGVAYYKDDSLIRKPFDFSYKNSFPLTDQQRTLRALLFPSSVDPDFRFNLTEDDRRFVLKYMSQLPTETLFPNYGCDTAYHPALVKFLMYANSKDSIPSNIRIFNKIGNAYGYLIDNAYIVDFDHGVEFMLAAVIFANKDGIFNDSNYDYDKIGFPFMRDLGQLVYRYELKRKRKHVPDLSEFRFTYDR